MLEGLGRQPPIHVGLPAVELAAWMLTLQPLQPQTVRKRNRIHRSPRIVAPSRC
jgi:hypothetical protein